MHYSRLVLASTLAGTLTSFSTTAAAQEPKAPSLPEAPPPGGDEDDLQTQLDELRDRLKQMEDEQNKKVNPLSINGYVDFGFFWPQKGNEGGGIVRDFSMLFPQFRNYAWVFYGDILGTPVNTRGEAADLGDTTGIVRYDSVDSRGNPGFIANEVNLRLSYQLAERALVRTSVNFVPRSSLVDFSLGDFVDVDLAEMEYVLTEDGKTSIFAGKMMPVFGIEYKERKSDQRFGITPSLIARYTTESQLGLKFRSKLLRDWFIVAASVTNNTSSSEQFHFHSEIDKNSGKTINGRLALSIPIGSAINALQGDRLELGGSYERGAQDWATDNEGDIEFMGADLQYQSANFSLKGQWMKGSSPGSNQMAPNVWSLDLHNSGYLEVDWQIFGYVGFYVRAEVRDALVTLRAERAYITKQRRFTGGLRIVFNPRIVLKLEYYANREYGGVPSFPNNMFTSSLVLSY
jgi:hypothetical protein